MPRAGPVTTEERFRIMALSDAGKSYAQIARTTGRPVKTVENMIARERKKAQAFGECRLKSWRCGGGLIRDGLCVYHAAVLERKLRGDKSVEV